MAALAGLRHDRHRGDRQDRVARYRRRGVPDQRRRPRRGALGLRARSAAMTQDVAEWDG